MNRRFVFKHIQSRSAQVPAPQGIHQCLFVDHRSPELVEHSVFELVSQRVYGIALGYEDINDHDELRRDALLATLVGKGDPTGAKRIRKRKRCQEKQS